MAKYTKADREIAARNVKQWGRDQEVADARGNQAEVTRLNTAIQNESRKLGLIGRFLGPA